MPPNSSTAPAATLPPCLHPGDRVVCFDGVCKFCGFWARFIFRNDPRATLKLATLQSNAGIQIRDWCGLPPDELNTVVFVDQGTPYFRSTAALKLARYLRWPWPLLVIFLLVPRPIRDFVYNRIAQHRYRLFGRTESCMLPSAEMKARFLKDEGERETTHG